MNKKITSLFYCFFFIFLIANNTKAQIITTYAGGGEKTSDGELAINSKLVNVQRLCADNKGNIYYSDGGLNVVKKIASNGIITTIAGNGIAGFSGDGGLAINAKLNQPYGIHADHNGNVYFNDLNNYRVRKIDNAGIITTIAGNGISAVNGDGGLAINASINFPQGISSDNAGNIYMTDVAAIRKINSAGIISTIAGNGAQGYSGDGGPATSAKLGFPNGISLDAAGNIYFSDEIPNLVRKINTSGIISTVAGGSSATGTTGNGGPATAALFGYIQDVVSDAVGNFYIVDGNNANIRKVNSATGVITNFAGNGSAGFSGDGGPAITAQLNHPWGIAMDTAGNLYTADIYNRRIRKITINYTLATTNTAVTQFLNEALSTHVNDNEFHRILTITPTEGDNMLSGSTAFKLGFDATVQTYNDVPYVQRHYDITPDVNPTTSKATVKLYFLQSEFDAYNTYVTSNALSLPLLPTSGEDNGNIKVTQFHGTGSAPGNYTGSTLLINPTVSWNAIDNYWELTFPVNGFSGFYVTTATMGLPLTLLSFTAVMQNNEMILNWKTTNEINVSHFEIERSADGNQFLKLNQMPASVNNSSKKNYSYTDKSPIQGINFYRLKMVDADGKFSYSKIVSLQFNRNNISFQIFPNPAKDILNVKVTGINENALIQITDITGRKVLEQKIILNGTTSIPVHINNLPNGIYSLLLKSKSLNTIQKFVKE